MNDVSGMPLTLLESEANARRAELFATVGKLKANLKPAHMLDEAKEALGRQAGSAWDSAQNAVSRHPFAAMCVTAAAAIAVGTSMGRKKPMDMAGLASASDAGMPQKTGPITSLRAKIAHELGSLAETSFHLVQDRYSQKLADVQNTAKAQVRGMTENVLDAGEKLIAALISDVLSGLKKPRH